jgi:hypothetical protein
MISLLNRQKSSAIEHAALNPQIRTLIIDEADSPFAVEYITPVSCHPSCLDRPLWPQEKAKEISDAEKTSISLPSQPTLGATDRPLSVANSPENTTTLFCSKIWSANATQLINQTFTPPSQSPAREQIP